MYRYNLSELEDIGTEWFRANLRQVCDQVSYHGARYALLRRGRPVAGIVPITEARALFEATRADREYRDIHRQLQTRDEDRLRQAVRHVAEAESVSGYGGHGR
ncbi:type II toxin-antitoxin system Phd/YefM family antitoxin [Marivita sp. GX14005]|uniref:type II toxin-antitoxin system Phd/YefM family antitoxin n=1 Tax=Marivita sp. GX14005 TaxID=2942276 RepID=UPI002019CC68|nr:type II toxin-antitoxin system Phd/YefM family antitoxin [Marivita sp. GX14005]MCL3881954.1 type II toxin-antitoxin system Phd/YefM family antitoxin [Marivita sp. GX14005]